MRVYTATLASQDDARSIKLEFEVSKICGG